MFSSNTSQVSSAANFIEDVFSTWLYTGNGATQTITNGIDLAGKGGMVIFKRRNGTSPFSVYDTLRTANTFGITTPAVIYTNLTDAQTGRTTNAPVWLSNGFSLESNWNGENFEGGTEVSWTFREQPKFFDVVTYTGDGVAGRQIPHNLGSTPGCIIVKRLNSNENWFVYHRSLGASNRLQFNTTDQTTVEAGPPFQTWNTEPTSTAFFVGSTNRNNGNGSTYVAYLFAHNAGGFGLSGTDNVISCGSFTGTTTVNLGYEPQWLMFKITNNSGDWRIVDNMRRWPVSGNPQELYPNLSQAESSNGGVNITSTGFSSVLGSGENYIYIAIRRGPMKVPTTGTSVFTPIAASFSTGTSRTVGFPADLLIATGTTNSADLNRVVQDRMRGFLNSNSTSDAAILYTNSGVPEQNSGVPPFAYNIWNTTALDGGYMSGYQGVEWFFRRAPSFFDVVCYSGNSVTGRTISHNLGVVPEMIIVKRRTSTDVNWFVYTAPTGASANLVLNAQNAVNTSSALWNSTSPTQSVFTVNDNAAVNSSSNNYVAYLFASCPGVSRVGTYTGNGSSQTINCGFTGGVRFVMVKRINSTGNWMVVDTARGLVTANDPTLYLNVAEASSSGEDWIDPDSSGFIVNQESTNNANVNGGTYVFLAIA